MNDFDLLNTEKQLRWTSACDWLHYHTRTNLMSFLMLYRNSVYYWLDAMESKILSVTAADIRFPTSLDKDGSDALVSICACRPNKSLRVNTGRWRTLYRVLTRSTAWHAAILLYCRHQTFSEVAHSAIV